MFATAINRSRRPTRRGVTLPAVVVLLTVLLGMVAFAIDTGYVAYSRTGLQRSADLAAAAGIARLYSGGTTTEARAEARGYVQANEGTGFAVPDGDIEFGLYDATAAAGSRYTANLNGKTPNALRVTVRRDGPTNARLNLFFAGIIGRSQNAVSARATTWMAPGQAVLPNAEIIPYVAQIDHFNAAAGQPARPATAPGFQSVAPSDYSDQYTIGAPGTRPAAGADGMRELLLFDSADRNTPGNWGSIDLGTASNGTPELIRQLLNGPNAGDFSILQRDGKLAADGSLQAPVSLGGDPGISNGTKSAWDQVIGMNKIIPLYSTVAGNGNNTVYTIVGFAGVRIVAADLQGNPKRVWVQPTSFYSKNVTPLPPGASGGMVGVFTPPRLVMP